VSRSRFRPIVLLAVVSLLVSAIAAPIAVTAVEDAPPFSDSAIFFAADGLRQDVVDDYVDDDADRFGTFAWLKENGVDSGIGMIPQAPPNTGAGWNSMASGTWVSETGTTNNTFHRSGTSFANRTSALGSSPSVLLTETAAQAWEKAGKRVALVEWAGGRDAPIQGPIVDFRSFVSGRGVTTNYIEQAPLDDAGFIAAFGLQFDSNLDHPGLSNTASDGLWAPDPLYSGEIPAVDLGWQGTKTLPKSSLPARATRMRVIDFGIDKYGLEVLIYSTQRGSNATYDHVIFDTDKNLTNGIVADLEEGDWGELKVTIQGGSLAGKTGGFLFKVERLDTATNNKPVYRLFHSSVTRANASWASWAGEPGFTGNFEDYIAETFPVSTAADFAVLEAGVVSEDTYVEQGLYWETGHFPIIEYIADTYDPDIFFGGYPVTDEFQHQFTSLYTETVPGPGGTGSVPNPAFDDFDLNGVADGLAAEREEYVRRAYQGANDTLALIKSELDANGNTDPVVFTGADHGFAPQYLALQAGIPLLELGLTSGEQISNCRTVNPLDVAKACWAGGALQIYLQLAGRDPDPRTQAQRDAGVADPRLTAAQYASTRAAIVAKYEGLTDPDHPDRKVIDSVYLKEETRYLDDGAGGTINMLHPSRTGDVVVFSYPPYQWDAATPGQLISPSHFFGQHGYEPKLVDQANNINMRAAFMAAGPGIAHRAVEDVRAIDLAPSLAYALGLPAPANAFGQVRSDIFENEDLNQVTLLNVSDFHGQIEPLTESVDGATFNIGGLGFIDTIWDEAEAESPGDDFRFFAGDSVGATPPISAFFEDFPTIEAMNTAEIDADGIGNHNFDAGQARTQAQADAADFPYLSANVFIEGTDDRPAYLQPYVIEELSGVRVAFIGFTNDDVPELVNPLNVADLEFRDPAPIINALADDLRANEDVDVVVALGHEGALNCTDPFGRACTGDLIDLAGQLSDVDVLAGDHTSRQVNLTMADADGDPLLVTENLSKGARYTEIKLVTNADGELLYKTARWHRPWNIGVASDPDIAAQIADLRVELQPILSIKLGESTVEIPRADPCGNVEGRTCESLIGNVVTDALRWSYNTDFAFTNSGGLRANLTCVGTQTTDPITGQPCKEGANFVIRNGNAIAVLPFGNISVTIDVTGAQLKSILENGVSQIGGGRFIQVSGLRFEYDPSLAVGSRVLHAWFFDAGVQGAEIDLTDTTTTYSVATNDFVAVGGDGYPNFSGQFTTLELMLDDLIDYLEANPVISPEIEDRHIGDAATAAP
jgi:2',3'-cyclic-nucleotide 2'-phosphodiesterase (5'-nucleotidase family)